MGKLTEEEYLSKKGRYLYISFTTKNPKTKRDFEKALNRLEKQRKSQKYKEGAKC